MAAAGTDSVDLTGELQWMQRMIDTHSATAEASGARIVHTCGFDSIPSDSVCGSRMARIGPIRRAVHHDRHAGEGHEGWASGGTIALMINVVDEQRPT